MRSLPRSAFAARLFAFAAALVFAGSVLGPAPRVEAAPGDGGKGKGAAADPLAPLAAETGIPLEVLRGVHAERALSADVNQRRLFLKEIMEEPRGELLALLVYACENDKDVPTQTAALRGLSLLGLLADRDDVLRLVKPLVERSVAKGMLAARFGLDETIRLNRWFRWDAEVTPFLKKVFEGDDFNMRSLAFDGLCEMRNGKIVEEVVKPACWKVYRSQRVSLFDRRRAIRTLVYLNDRTILPEMQNNLRHDARVAIESAWGLTRMLDPSSLTELRKLDMTAVHRLRFPCWLARCLLDDPTCLDEVVRVAANRLEHHEVKYNFVSDIGEMASSDKARAVLEKLWESDRSEAVQLGAAVGLLKLGDARGVDLLKKKILDPWKDDPTLRYLGKAWMCQFRFMEEILRIRTKEVGPLLVAMTQVEPKSEDRFDKDGKEQWWEWWRHGVERTERVSDWYNEYKADAVRLCGELGLKDTLPRLRELSYGTENWGHLKFHALVSRWELGDPKALGDLRWYLPKYDDSFFGDIYVTVGPVKIYTKRLKWSSIFDVCSKAERVDDIRYLDLLEELLKTEVGTEDPMAPGWAKRVRGGAEEGGTTGRDEVSPLERPPEVRYLCRNQFVRRAIALAAARIGNEKAAPQLARALRDSRAVVRAAALEEIGRISGRYKLDIGATAKEEHAVFSEAVAWLKEKGVWPN